MAEIHNGRTSDAANAKKRKGFWSSVLGRSSSADGNKDDQQPKRKGFMNSLVNNARHEATKEVMHVAEKEAVKQVKAQLNNNNGSQPPDTDTTTANMTPDTSTATPNDDVLSAQTNWAKRMVDSAQQKMQNLQNLASS